MRTPGWEGRSTGLRRGHTTPADEFVDHVAEPERHTMEEQENGSRRLSH